MSPSNNIFEQTEIHSNTGILILSLIIIAITLKNQCFK